MSSPPPPSIHDGLARVRLVALDVDGCLTDGRVTYVTEVEVQSFSVHDGLAIKWLLEADVEVAWISGRASKATMRRAQELGIRELHHMVAAKAPVLAELQERLGIPPDRTIAMGDDLPDLGLALHAGLFVCPRNARPEMKVRANWVTEARGGEGAVRELGEAILRAKGLWEGRIGRYRSGDE